MSRQTKLLLAGVAMLLALAGSILLSGAGRARRYDWFGTYSGPLGCPRKGGSTIYGDPQNALWQFDNWYDAHVSCVVDPLGSGRAVQRFAIPDTDRQGNASPRGDSFSNYLLRAGMDKYVSIPMYTPASTRAAGAGNIVPPRNCGSSGPTFFLFAQLEWPGQESPPAITVTCTNARGTVRWALDCCANTGEVVWTGPPIDNAWHDLILHLHFESAAGSSDGSLQVWRDGVRQTLSSGRTTIRGLHFLPRGYRYTVLALDSYRSRVGCSRYGLMCGTYTFYHGAAAIGPTYASVARTVSRPPTGP